MSCLRPIISGSQVGFERIFTEIVSVLIHSKVLHSKEAPLFPLPPLLCLPFLCFSSLFQCLPSSYCSYDYSVWQSLGYVRATSTMKNGLPNGIVFLN